MLPKHIGREGKCEINTMWASMNYDFETKFGRNPNEKQHKAKKKVELIDHDTLA